MSNNHSSNGFLLGLILGGALVFLLGTEKGRKVLKAVTEEGFEELSSALEDAEDEVEDMEEEEMPGPKKEFVSEEVSAENMSNGHAKPLKKRFFRRTSKS